MLNETTSSWAIDTFDENEQVGAKSLYKQIQKEMLINFLMSLNPVVIDGVIHLKNLRIQVSDRLSLLSKEEIVIQSGRDKNKNGYLNSVHINPDLDNKNNPIRRNSHVPFSKLRFREKPRRPVSNHKNCRCC